MDLEMIKAALVLHFLFCQQVDSVISSLSKYHMSSKNESDNILDDFITRFKTAYLEKRVPRHVTLVGASTEDLREVETLFESYPCIICTEPKACFYRWWFSPGSFVIIFLDDLREETFIDIVNILSQCRICKILYIFRGIIENNHGIRSLFNLTVQKYGINAQFAHLEKNVTKFYGSFIAENCSIEVRSIAVWTPRTTLNVIDSWTSGLRDLNGCIVTLSTLNFAPKMVINEYENGSLTIAGGLEGQLILAFAKKFNFTLESRYPSMPERLKYSRKSAIVLDVDNGVTEIGIGRLRPYTSDIYQNIGYSIAYDHDCITWGVPHVMIWADNVIWLEFTWQVWTLVGLVFMIICVIGNACHNVDLSMNGIKQENMGFVAVVLDVVAIHLGNAPVNVPTSVSGKFILIMGLYYALVVSTAYKTSLASILTTDNGLPAIVDIKGIIEANLSVGGGSYNLDFLKDQVNEYDIISKLIDRFVVINDPSEVMRRLRFNSNFACLSRRSALLHERNRIAKTQKPLPFNILRDCVLYHETVIVFRKESLLREQADDMIRRLLESGILEHWDSLVYDPESMTKQRSSVAKHSTMGKFKNIYFLYTVCIAFCFIAFLTELGIAMQDSLKKKKKICAESRRG